MQIKKISGRTLFFLGGTIFNLAVNNHFSSAAQAKEAETTKLKEEHSEKKVIKLSKEQIKRFSIETIKITSEHYRKKMLLPGEVTLNENMITHVVSPVQGVATEIFKNLGDEVKDGDVLALIQSREMAETRSAYLAAYKDYFLQKDIFEREEKLWKQGMKAAVIFIKTRNAYESSKIDLEQKKQKLIALNLSEEEIKGLPGQTKPFNLYEIKSSINGKVIERHLTRGEATTNDKPLFIIANLDTVWVNLSIPTEDLNSIEKGQKVEVFGHNKSITVQGTIAYASPIINEESVDKKFFLSQFLVIRLQASYNCRLLETQAYHH